MFTGVRLTPRCVKDVNGDLVRIDGVEEADVHPCWLPEGHIERDGAVCTKIVGQDPDKVVSRGGERREGERDRTASLK